MPVSSSQTKSRNDCPAVSSTESDTEAELEEFLSCSLTFANDLWKTYGQHSDDIPSGVRAGWLAFVQPSGVILGGSEHWLRSSVHFRSRQFQSLSWAKWNGPPWSMHGINSCSFTIKLSSPAHTGRRGGSIPTLAARVRGPSLKFLPHSWQTITFFIPFRLQRHLLLLLAFHPLTITLLQLCEASVYHADFARPVGWATLDSCIPVLVGLEIQKRILDLQVQARVSLGVRFHCQRRPKFLAGPSTDPQGKANNLQWVFF